MLKLSQINKKFGALTATDNLTLEIKAGDLHALIGPNGAGKTTLINQISGELKSDSGEIIFNGSSINTLPINQRVDLGLARSYQITSIFPEFTTLENVALAVQAQQGHSYNLWKAVKKDKQQIEQSQEVMGLFGLQPFEKVLAKNLPHGQQRRLEIALALAVKPKMLLLDEPMAGLGPEEEISMIELLEQLKQEFTILLVEHDMNAVFRLADQITVLDSGKEVLTGTADEVRNSTEVQAIYLGSEQVAV